MNLNIKVIAVMVNWNGKTFLQSSIPSVLAELKIVQGILILVDNASTDGSVAYVAQHFPDVVILKMDSNLGGSGGFSAGMRCALKYPTCQFIWLLDNDIVAEPNSLSALLNCLVDNPNAGAAGSQICLYDAPDTVQEVGAKITPWLSSLHQYHSGLARLPATKPTFQVDYLAACSVLIKRSCLEQIGVFADFFIFYDDVEWGLRAKQAGWILLGVPASVIRHQYNATKPTVAWREYYKKRNRLAFLATYLPQRGGIFASLIYLVNINFLIYLYKRQNNIDLYRAILWARQDGLSGRLGKRDLSSLDSSIKQPDIINISGLNDILVDIRESAGDAFYLMNHIYQYNPATCFYLPTHLQRYLNYFKKPFIYPAINRKHEALIIGREFKINSLIRASRIFSYQNGQLLELSISSLGKELITRCAALLFGLLLTPFHWSILIYRRKLIRKSITANI